MGFPGDSVVTKPSAVKKMQVQSLGQKDPLEKEMASHFSILARKNPMDRAAWQATVHRVPKELDTTEHARTHIPITQPTRAALFPYPALSVSGTWQYSHPQSKHIFAE